MICAYIIKCASNYINNESEVILTFTIHETQHSHTDTGNWPTQLQDIVIYITCWIYNKFLTWSDGPLMSIFKNCLAHPLITLFAPKTDVFIKRNHRNKKRNQPNNKTRHLNPDLNFKHKEEQNLSENNWK